MRCFICDELIPHPKFDTAGLCKPCPRCQEMIGETLRDSDQEDQVIDIEVEDLFPDDFYEAEIKTEREANDYS